MDKPSTTVSWIRNGEVFVKFFTYSCRNCGIDLPECDPHIQTGDGFHSCCDCAFLRGDIDDKEYLKTKYYWVSGKAYAFIEDGKIIVGAGERRPSPTDSRKSAEYIRWRNSVYVRDKYTCVRCGVVGGVLNAHHIKPYKKYKELRLDINNGETLCVKRHRYEHGAH